MLSSEIILARFFAIVDTQTSTTLPHYEESEILERLESEKFAS